MLKGKLSSIKDTLLEYNTYFNDGYDDVYITETGIVANNKIVFPNDKKGNYFYLRLPDSVTINNTSEYKISDCRSAMGLSVDTFLVASVSKADADVLLDNLISTLASMGLKIKSAIWQKHKVVMQELAKAGAEAQQKALQNVNTTLVSVRFEYNGTYEPTSLNCITNPCSC